MVFRISTRKIATNKTKKNELNGKIIKEFVTLRPKVYSYLTGDGYVGKKTKNTNKCVIKRKIKFGDYEACLENNRTI